MNGLWQDVRYAVRGFGKNPGFTAVAVLTLALGIGANTAIFSIIDHVILRPLAYEDPDRLYVVHEVIPSFAHMAGGAIPAVSVVPSHFLQWRRTSTSFEGMALLSDHSFTLTGAGEPELVPGARVSAELFTMLGVQARLGRTFLPEENQLGRDRVVLLNDELWRFKFGGDPRIVGRAIMLNGSPHQVIGVLPSDFRFPKLADLYPTVTYEPRPQVWKPLGLTRAEEQEPANFDFNCIVRLKPGATLEQALGEINAAQAVIAKVFPDNIELRAQMIPLADQITSRSRTGLQLLFAAVSVVLVIACVNITNLLLAGAVARRKEVAVRSAIGASRARIVRQMLAEALVLSLAAAVIGIIVAQATLQAVAVVAPVDLPRFDEVAVDSRILVFALAMSVLATVFVGLLPAWQSASADPQDAMRSSRTATAGQAAGRVRAVLVGVQVALSAVCLIAAGLLLHSFVRLLNVDPGFRADRIVTAELTFSPVRYPNQQARTAFLDAVLERLAAAPGIRRSGVTNGLPLTAQGGNGPLFVDGVNVPIWERPVADIRGVDTAFFETLGIPLISGSVFDRRDRDRLVVVLSEALAARMWPGSSPIGRRVRIGLPNAPEAEVIGVVGDVHNTTLEGRAFPAIYLPYWQRPRMQWTLIAKTAAGAETGYAAVRAAIQAVDPEMPVPSLKTMDDVVMASVAPRQFQMRLVVLFGLVALFLASLGIYGVVSYSVAQRSSEIGLRIALGASIGRIATTVLRQGMLPVMIGLAVGLLASIGVGRALRAMLFGVSPADATTLVIATFVLLAVGLLACYIPARRAARIDPLVALRYE